MKKYLFIFFLLVTATGAVAQQVAVVKDNAKRHQLEREVAIRWNKFTPLLYFMALHNKYRTGPDRRNIKQLLPLLAAIRLNHDQTEQYQEDVEEIYNQELFKMADRSINKSFYLLYENKIKNLNRSITLLNAEAITAGVELDMLLALKGEQERINADIELTKEAYQDDSKKAEQFRIALEDLTKLRGYYRRLINLFKTSNKLLSK
ncbi:MAG: hypothetical protein COW65_16150 [Cytophagales bacterium CG18_big_fil_WC_8_21_14_2_50_42_9]|nr:MAG: hypothetical protein COW65_16150 [Cytophagales bacterium CG18_big_fil_WC_8_21_14_2_50_42_9]